MATSKDKSTLENVVIIAVDGSEQAEHAFLWYMQNAYRPDHRVKLAHCIPQPLLFGAEISRVTYTGIMDEAHREGAQVKCKFTNLMHQHGLGAMVNCAMDPHPDRWLVELTKTEQPQLLVMGSRGLGTLRRTVLGSVSDYVLQHAHCAVAVCHLPSQDS